MAIARDCRSSSIPPAMSPSVARSTPRMFERPRLDALRRRPFARSRWRARRTGSTRSQRPASIRFAGQPREDARLVGRRRASRRAGRRPPRGAGSRSPCRRPATTRYPSRSRARARRSRSSVGVGRRIDELDGLLGEVDRRATRRRRGSPRRSPSRYRSARSRSFGRSSGPTRRPTARSRARTGAPASA